MKAYYQAKWVTIYHGDCREVLPVIDKASAIVTDPPYELGFMGKAWDSKGVSFQKETWQVIRNACKSGAMLLSFGGTRTFHRIACAIEDAGFEYRDTIMWVYSQGFPKSLDISKAIDKQFGVEREIVSTKKNLGHIERGDSTIANQTVFHQETIFTGKTDIEFNTIPNTPEAQLWNGYGTALKPAYEPIIVAMNPLDGTFAQNALKHGVAGLNIDECRIPLNGDKPRQQDIQESHTNTYGWSKGGIYKSGEMPQSGRFPANFIHDGSQAVMELFPNSKGQCGDIIGNEPSVPAKNTYGEYGRVPAAKRGDNGSAARFFYCAKASKSERDKGCEELEESTQYVADNAHKNLGHYIVKMHGGNLGDSEKSRNNHPTVKPLALMEYLVKLVKMPEYNLVIDPFVGSGTTLLACIRLGIPCIGIDSDEKSCEIAVKRSN